MSVNLEELLARIEALERAAAEAGWVDNGWMSGLVSQVSDKPQRLVFPSGWSAPIVSDDKAEEEYEPIDEEVCAPLIPAFPDSQLSTHFRLREFRPSDNTFDLIRLSPKLIELLEYIVLQVGLRARADGRALHVTSGYRPGPYNRKVGGVANSTHIDGLAADIYSDWVNVDELYRVCDEAVGDRGGVGFYRNQGFVHVDLRGYRARW